MTASTHRPRLLDLFCGAGGCSMGYHRAGFDVVGIDHVPQPNYPFAFRRIDVMSLWDDLDWVCSFDAIHASPPCQDRSTAAGRARKSGTSYDQLIPATRGLLIAADRPYIMENVEGAKDLMVSPVRYCGSSFGLDVRRHRLFESDVGITPPPCAHAWQTPRFRSLDSRMAKAGKLASVVGVHGHCNYAGEAELRRKAMDIDWMSSYELTQAIPPAYTEHIGRQLIEAIA